MIPKTPKSVPAIPLAAIPSGIQARGKRSGGDYNGTLLRQPHPDWLIEAAFICYIEGGCTVPSAARLLKERWEAYAPFDVIDAETGEVVQEPYFEIPRATWHSWRKRYGWDTRAAEEISADFPAQMRLKAVRAAIGGDVAMAYLIKTVVEDAPDVPTRDKIEASKVLVTVAGEGALGTLNRTAPVIAAIKSHMDDFAGMSGEDINRELRSLIHRTNTPHPDRRR